MTPGRGAFGGGLFTVDERVEATRTPAEAGELVRTSALQRVRWSVCETVGVLPPVDDEDARIARLAGRAVLSTRGTALVAQPLPSPTPSPLGVSFASPLPTPNSPPPPPPTSIFPGPVGPLPPSFPTPSSGSGMWAPSAPVEPAPRFVRVASFALGSPHARFLFTVSKLSPGEVRLQGVEFRLRLFPERRSRAPLAPHLFSRLARTALGRRLLLRSTMLHEASVVMMDPAATSIRRRAACWSLGHVASTRAGFALLVDHVTPDFVLRLDTLARGGGSACPGLRATALQVLGLVSRTHRARAQLETLGWTPGPTGEAAHMSAAVGVLASWSASHLQTQHAVAASVRGAAEQASMGAASGLGRSWGLDPQALRAGVLDPSRSTFDPTGALAGGAGGADAGFPGAGLGASVGWGVGTVPGHPAVGVPPLAAAAAVLSQPGEAVGDAVALATPLVAEMLAPPSTPLFPAAATAFFAAAPQPYLGSSAHLPVPPLRVRAADKSGAVVVDGEDSDEEAANEAGAAGAGGRKDAAEAAKKLPRLVLRRQRHATAGVDDRIDVRDGFTHLRLPVVEPEWRVCLDAIASLAVRFTQKEAQQTLVTLREKQPALFAQPGLYWHMNYLLTEYSYSLPARRFIHSLFDGIPFGEREWAPILNEAD